MSQVDKKVIELIDSIAHKREQHLRFPIMSGTIVAGSVDEDAMTVTVELSVDDADVPTEAINLNVVLNNVAGAYGIPADGAYCLVAEVDGPDKWELLKASAYTKIVCKADTLIQFNDGSKGGLVEIQKLKDNLKAIHDYIFTTLQPAIASGITAVGAGGAANGATGAANFNTAVAGQDITYEDMENTKITQG